MSVKIKLCKTSELDKRMTIYPCKCHLGTVRPQALLRANLWGNETLTAYADYGLHSVKLDINEAN